ncbi:MAG: right-handed parallel beta-helix repeat-containing protein [Candidatus Methanospirare jalkutatii]|nr:MAG: right-handed parallel beta-helix repeat-containing protein [Candidatus Methanospirare jalkutatii]UYZ40861.1 MAG: right-handed parallel beta-helix repeat-containing protein [Candidatus Methanospirare jalkutatii]
MMCEGKLVFPVFASFLILTAFACVSEAKTIYMPDDYAKIQWAVDNATDEDTIIVRDGIYVENIDINKPNLTIKSENGSANCIVRAANPYDHVFNVTADNVTIKGFTVTGATGYWRAGIYLYNNPNNCRIENVNASDNWCGIYLWESGNNIISGNNISNNWGGIYLVYSNNNSISGNNISSNNIHGIYLGSSSNDIITGNTMTNNGIIIDGDKLQHWNTHIIENNTVNGKPIYYFKNKIGGKVPEDAGQVILANCTGIIIENLTVTNAGGIELGFSSQNTIKNNNVSSNNYNGIYLYSSSNNSISGNNILNNGVGGIYLSHSSNNSIHSNSFINNGNAIPPSPGYAGIGVKSSNKNLIKDNIFEDNNVGIFLPSSTNNLILNNIFNNNSLGIYFAYSLNNYISNNTLTNNHRCIRLEYSSSNFIYLNNFINNTDQVDSYSSTNIWNSTEPITYTYNGSQYTNYLGNYWSDYTGKDNNSDGIGDTPYSIDSDKDNYPLIERFENYFMPTKAKIFDTGRPENPYPSISGKFIGTIRTNTTIIATKLYTYSCEGTGGHTEYALICNSTWCAEASWKGYEGDWMNISFNRTVILMPYETYNITIITGSYPQIHHTPSLKTENGWINCTEFIDANGKKYEDWIPAIMLWS